MCGIAGYVTAGEAASAELVERQLRTLDHRGPDASGIHLRGPAAIGQNRLSIIDLVTGDPPVTNEDGRVGVANNGEIYNFRRLREELEAAGHELRTRGDTEVIAHLGEVGEPVELARQLDGMFAFALWDEQRDRLVLGRDRLGKKPLYYWCAGGTLVFGSEIKALLAHPAVPRELEPRAIPGYLRFGYVPTPYTFFAGIKSLPPGHVLSFTSGGEPRVEAFWEPPAPDRPGPERSLALPEAASAVRERLAAAVERRLVADVPVGAFLSGGVDSSIVVGLMAQLSGEPVRTFTVGFEDAGGLDERPYAREVAELNKTDHTEFVVRPDAVDLVERLVWHHDQPFGDSSAIPTYLLSEFTGQHVSVALSGDGGDELFAGYERFSVAGFVGAYRRLPRPLRGLARRTTARLPARALGGRVESVRRFTHGAEAGMPDAYLSWMSCVPPRDRRELLEGDEDEAGEAYRDIWNASAGADQLDRLLDLNLRTYLLDDLLVKADRMSMAHGLEVRSPLLDSDLLELAAALSPHHKVRGWSRKRVLKAACEDLLPRRVARRRKRGFAVPVDRWFRTQLRPYVDATLAAPDARLRRHLDGEAIDRLLEEHASGRTNRGHELWALLTLEIFLVQQGW